MIVSGLRWGRTLALGLGLLGLGAIAHADTFKWFGAHGAYYYDFQKAAVGLETVGDLGQTLEVVATGDYVFTRGRETFAGHLDLQYLVPIAPKSVPIWVGGGFGMEHINPDGPLKAESRFFTSALAGVGFTKGPWMPYLQARAILREKGQAVISLGIRF
jgi:hypothetical protein